ncbi:DUF421 domain-containing protein [Dokdonella sp. MW10]|uniref:DUF421 domain-containing protein n=1 Tax=Dokdonella sp. MW10 TaxID=2992926 RepID=UPI003F7F2FA5
MFELQLPWWELVLRGVIVYIAVLVMMRISGKRTVGEFTPFDVIVLMLLSEAASNSMTGGEESVQGGLIVVATLIGLNYLSAFLSTRSSMVDKLLQGRPVVLIRRGKVIKDALLANNMPENDLREAMRSQAIRRYEDVELALLEPDGEVSFFKRDASEDETSR